MFAVSRQITTENGRTVLTHVVVEENMVTLTISDETGLVSKDQWNSAQADVVLELLSLALENADEN